MGCFFSLQVQCKLPQLIRGNKDEHGCLTAAGYTWSELRRGCIRIFEDGVRVDDPSLQPLFSVVRRVCGRQQPGGGFPSVSVSNEVLDRRGVWQKICKLYREQKPWELCGKVKSKQTELCRNELSIICQMMTRYVHRDVRSSQFFTVLPNGVVPVYRLGTIPSIRRAFADSKLRK